MEEQLSSDLRLAYRDLAIQRRSAIAFIAGVCVTFSEQDLVVPETRKAIIEGVLQAADSKLVMPANIADLSILEDQLGDTAALLGTAATDRTSKALLQNHINNRQRNIIANDPVLQRQYTNGLSLLHDVARRRVERSSGSGKERK